MMHTLLRKAAGLLPLFPFLAVLQSGPLTREHHPIDTPSPRELMPVSRQAASFHIMTVVMDVPGLRVQAALLPASSGLPSLQDSVYSLHPHRDGEGPLPIPQLLIRTGVHHA